MTPDPMLDLFLGVGTTGVALLVAVGLWSMLTLHRIARPPQAPQTTESPEPPKAEPERPKPAAAPGAGYTYEELLAVPGATGDPLRLRNVDKLVEELRAPWRYDSDSLRYRVRLALAFPERARLALGDGWSVLDEDGAVSLVWQHATEKWGLALDLSGVRQRTISAGPIPPEVDQALRDARLFVDAWKRIEAGKIQGAGAA